MLVHVWFGSILCTAVATGYSHSFRNDLIVETLSYFHVDHCILLLNLPEVGFEQRMKHLAKRNIFTTIMNDVELTQRIQGSLFPPYKEAVVGDLDTMEMNAVLPLVCIFSLGRPSQSQFLST